MEGNGYGHRRIVDRTPCFLRGDFLPLGGISQKVVCEDISAKGAGILTSTPMAINSYIMAELLTPKAGRLAVRGRICWCRKEIRGWRSGVSFDRSLAVDVDQVLQ